MRSAFGGYGMCNPYGVHTKYGNGVVQRALYCPLKADFGGRGERRERGGKKTCILTNSANVSTFLGRLSWRNRCVCCGETVGEKRGRSAVDCPDDQVRQTTLDSKHGNSFHDLMNEGGVWYGAYGNMVGTLDTRAGLRSTRMPVCQQSILRA